MLKIPIQKNTPEAFVKEVERNVLFIKALPYQADEGTRFEIDAVVVNDWCYGNGTGDYS